MSRPSQAVIEAVAAKQGVAPTELSTPLYEVIDCDALDALYTGPPDTSAPSPTVKFMYYDYTIVITGPEDVQVQARAN